MFSRPKILFLVSLLFVALLNSIPTYLLEFLNLYIYIYIKCNYLLSITGAIRPTPIFLFGFDELVKTSSSVGNSELSAINS